MVIHVGCLIYLLRIAVNYFFPQLEPSAIGVSFISTKSMARIFNKWSGRGVQVSVIRTVVFAALSSPATDLDGLPQLLRIYAAWAATLVV